MDHSTQARLLLRLPSPSGTGNVDWCGGVDTAIDLHTAVRPKKRTLRLHKSITPALYPSVTGGGERLPPALPTFQAHYAKKRTVKPGLSVPGRSHSPVLRQLASSPGSRKANVLRVMKNLSFGCCLDKHCEVELKAGLRRRAPGMRSVGTSVVLRKQGGK